MTERASPRGGTSAWEGAVSGAAGARLSTLTHADYFGEMALLDDAPRSATVRAEAAGELLRLERGRFLQLLEREPRIAYAVARTLSRRLRAADRSVLQSARAIA